MAQNNWYELQGKLGWDGEKRHAARSTIRIDRRKRSAWRKRQCAVWFPTQSLVENRVNTKDGTTLSRSKSLQTSTIISSVVKTCVRRIHWIQNNLFDVSKDYALPFNSSKLGMLSIEIKQDQREACARILDNFFQTGDICFFYRSSWRWKSSKPACYRQTEPHSEGG